jgi:hypothetical protein
LLLQKEDEKITLEEYGERGRRLREVLDGAQWALGDIALDVISDYGASAVDEWAKDVGIGRSTAYEYKGLCVFYEKSARADYLDMPTLTYSHFRVAKRLNSVTLAYELLDLAALNAWSVDQTEFHMFADEPFASVMREDEPDDSDDEPEPTPILSDAPVHLAVITNVRGLARVTFDLGTSYADALQAELSAKHTEFLLTLTRR